MNDVKRILVDARNYDYHAPIIVRKMKAEGLSYIGIDCETEDSRKHPGLIAANAKKKGIIFDIRRTTMCGISIHIDGDDSAYYFNLGHADAENRLSAEQMIAILDSKPRKVNWVAHNAVYERTIFKMCLDYMLEPIICSMYLCVTAYNPDTYTPSMLPGALIEGIKPLMRDIIKEFTVYDPSKELTSGQADVFYKFAAKESDSAWSYNGVIKSINWGYDLKKATRSWFGYQMKTFEETLGGRDHMGQLTGAGTVDYGCDDAIWCLRLYHKIIGWLVQNNPKVIETFFRQENPMVEVYSDAWMDGIRIDVAAIESRFQLERQNASNTLIRLRNAIKGMLPTTKAERASYMTTAPTNEWLLKNDKWYQDGGHLTYRGKLLTWLEQPDGTMEEELARVGGALFEDAETSGTAIKKKAPKGNINLSHYMPVRTIIYDLFREKPIYVKGELKSDADAKGRLMERIVKRLDAGEGDIDAEWEKSKLEVMLALNDLARIEQVMKLYLKPYKNLLDPETGRVYPTIQALLATRRTSMSNPNGQQLAKRGESVYVRGFYLPDDDDEAIISADWSSIELVLPGEFSGDPAFIDAFSQIPYKDLHSIACIGAIKAWKGVELTLDQFKEMKNCKEHRDDWYGLPLVSHKGKRLTPADYFGYARTEIGKVSNFNYWYSGALGSVGEKLGWTSDIMWAATEQYRQTFPVAEQWRKDVIALGAQQGYIQLPDHCIRYRFEATADWAALVMETFRAFGNDAMVNFAKHFVKKWQTRAKNQLVNALIQGMCAALMKRSALKMRVLIKEHNLKARFMLPIHDELLFSVKKEEIQRFIPIFRGAMCDHKDVVSRVALNANVAIGRNFEPFKSNPKGQIEIDEAPKVKWLREDQWEQALDEKGIDTVIKYLWDELDQKVAA